MFRLNKDFEYSLILLSEMAKSGVRQTAGKLSERYNLPLKLTSRIMNILRNRGILKSIQGKYGGYILNRNPEDITLIDLKEALYGKESAAECLDDKVSCIRTGRCNIRPGVQYIQSVINNEIGSITMKDIIEKESSVYAYKRKSS